ncbi:TIGR03364 family FAD-dependent oxidoreductase [Maribacter sp.]|uniref:TIGR03364 family FAD-dependent oxidoreductase n=1 Tax=Maribacter sp. TaxID=1897614 RepID=UPI0025C2899C|nr:TIGR03364 family FAD-dependent oxidoreductase [Maribacter sp.]
MNNEYDLIVIGGGVLGTFHAYQAIQNGLKVALLEKDRMPQGATIRNFGQVVPSGMNSKWQKYGRESLKIYKEIQSKHNVSVRQEGTVYIASNEEEVQLIEELRAINESNNYSSMLLTKEETLNKYPGLNKDYVKAGLFFPEEVMVEPLSMIGKLHMFLRSLGLDLFFNKTVIECNALSTGVIVHTSDGNTFSAEKIIICNGSDFKILYPKFFAESQLVAVKLQMMSTQPQSNFRLPSSILTGHSIRRYEAFQECPSFKQIKRLEDQNSLIKKWGIHILFKQAQDGSIIIGDSHEYTNVSSIHTFGIGLNMEIDCAIINEAKKIFNLPNYKIKNRWFGIYSQCSNSDIYEKIIDKSIHIVTGIGGKGMTGSAGFAKENIIKIFNL